VAVSFQLELEHLISHEAPQRAILSDATGTDIPSLHTFLEILSGNSLEYDSDDIDCYTPPCMCYHITRTPLRRGLCPCRRTRVPVVT
jgi:hypothetical protein